MGDRPAPRHGLGDDGRRRPNAPRRPFRAAVEDLLTLADYRGALLAVWGAVALVAGRRDPLAASRRADARRLGGAPPLALALVVGVVCCLAALTVMAQGGFDAYAMYGYPPLVVLYALLVAGLVSRRRSPGDRRRRRRTGGGGADSVYRPVAMAWDLAPVAALWLARPARRARGASPRFRARAAIQAGARRAEPRNGTPSRALRSPTRNQVLDCIGGIA
ncbi:MAG: hypothetical protein U0802_22310 [Candidatus Binatia bacterium]